MRHVFASFLLAVPCALMAPLAAAAPDAPARAVESMPASPPAAPPAQALAATPEVALVKELYRRFAWEASLAARTAGKGRRLFAKLPARELARYLEPDLAELLAADQACAGTQKGSCKVDFAPLWDSQEPSADQVTVKAGEVREVVVVEFVARSGGPGVQGKPVTLLFEMVRLPTGPRVRDIHYSGERSLRAALGDSDFESSNDPDPNPDPPTQPNPR